VHRMVSRVPSSRAAGSLCRTLSRPPCRRHSGWRRGEHLHPVFRALRVEHYTRVEARTRRSYIECSLERANAYIHTFGPTSTAQARIRRPCRTRVGCVVVAGDPRRRAICRPSYLADEVVKAAVVSTADLTRTRTGFRDGGVRAPRAPELAWLERLADYRVARWSLSTKRRVRRCRNDSTRWKVELEALLPSKCEHAWQFTVKVAPEGPCCESRTEHLTRRVAAGRGRYVWEGRNQLAA